MRRSQDRMHLGILLWHVLERPMYSKAIKYSVRIHSSFVPLACGWGCTLGPGAVGWLAEEEGPGGALEVGGGGTR